MSSPLQKRLRRSSSNLIVFPGHDERALRAADEPAVTLVDLPREEPSSSEPAATLVDPHLGALIAQALVERAPPAAPEQTLVLPTLSAIPAAPHTMPMLDAPVRKPTAEADPTEMMLAIPDAAPSGWGLSSETTEIEAFRGGEPASRRPALVAHVFAARRDYTLAVAFLAWSLVVAFAVYLVTAHSASRLDAQPRASASASSAAPAPALAPAPAPR